MPKDIQIRNGTNLNLEGDANKILVDIPVSKTFALNPDDFFNIIPKLIVKEGDFVKKGSPLFFSKQNPRIHFVSPVAGEVTAIVRGEKRKIQQVVITSDESNEVVTHEVFDFESLDADAVKEIILKSGRKIFSSLSVIQSLHLTHLIQLSITQILLSIEIL